MRAPRRAEHSPTSGSPSITPAVWVGVVMERAEALRWAIGVVAAAADGEDASTALGVPGMERLPAPDGLRGRTSDWPGDPGSCSWSRDDMSTGEAAVAVVARGADSAGEVAAEGGVCGRRDGGSKWGGTTNKGALQEVAWWRERQEVCDWVWISKDIPLRQNFVDVLSLNDEDSPRVRLIPLPILFAICSKLRAQHGIALAFR